MDIGRTLEATVGGLGYELVAWERAGRAGLLRIFVDKPGGVEIDDCARVSQHLSRVLEVEGVNYDRLEVSSPGLDRVLRKEADFVRFAGEKVRLKLRLAVGGQRNFTGTVRAAKNGKLEVEVDGTVLAFDLGNIEKARLVPNI